ncbi:MAG: hypothetical protein IT379_12910 [Deltaproteobacteria bacterium]|nr:hypothetical protein [Deltaproteobacteria bacterium]
MTCGLLGLLGIPHHVRSKWFVENLERDGRRFVYEATWLDSLGFQLATNLLIIVTCGLAAPFVAVASLRFRARHMTTAEGHRCEFDGDYLTGAAIWLGGVILSLCTCGLGIPVAVVWWTRFAQEGLVVLEPVSASGRNRLSFGGGALSFLVEGLIIVLLMWITLGLYFPWALARMERWVWGATGDELSPSLAVSEGPRSSQDWIRVAAIAVPAVFVAMAAFGVVGIAAAAFLRERSAARAAASAPITSTHGDEEETEGWGDDPESDDSTVVASDTVRIQPSYVSASSELREGRRYVHAARNAFDGRNDTAWGEGAIGSGAGQWIEATLPSRRLVQRIEIVPGFDKWHPRSGDLFFRNAHLRRFRLRFDDGTVLARHVEHGSRSHVVAGLQEWTRRVRLEVDEVWPGTRWEDLQISEIALYGR